MEKIKGAWVFYITWKIYAWNIGKLIVTCRKRGKRES